MMVGSCGDTCGWISAIVAMVSFGSFGVPMKCEASERVDVDPLVFQTYKTAMCFVTSWLVILLGITPSFTAWGIVSGFFWVPGGTAGIYAVRKAGLAISVGIWSSVIVGMSFFWGIFVFGENVRSTMGACLAGLCLIGGIWGMSMYSSKSPGSITDSAYTESDSVFTGSSSPICSPDVNTESTPTQKQHPSISSSGTNKYHSITIEDIHVTNLSKDREQHKVVQFCGLEIKEYSLGIAGAVFNGLWAGTMMVPLHFAKGSTHGLPFVISFGIGAAIINLLLWTLRYAYHATTTASFRGGYDALPPFHFRTMCKPACLAGMLWSLGNMCSILTVTALGQGVGFSVIQAAMLVSGLWGIFYYEEVVGGVAIRNWFGSASVTVFGILWLSYEHQQ